jgi:predicted RNase H-like HicB family nuclease
LTYSVTLEHGSDSSCLAWVHELPGCFVRGAGCAETLERLPDAIRAFLEWLRRAGEEVGSADEIEVRVVDEVGSRVETAEDTEALVRPDREPLTVADWSRLERWLTHSRRDVEERLAALPDERLGSASKGGSRTVREELIHIGLVELMYLAWTFDLTARPGLSAFLEWTREVAVARMRHLAEHGDGATTAAEWQGAPRAEEWTARKEHAG